MAKKEKSDKINDALLKVALGYQVAEVTEEYAEVDGELKLTKRKKTKKDVPPDLKAVQLLLAESGGEEYAAWSEEQLEEERLKLLSALSNAQGEEEKSVRVTKEKSAPSKKSAYGKGVKAKSVKKSVKKTGRKGTGKARALSKKEDKE